MVARGDAAVEGDGRELVELALRGRRRLARRLRRQARRGWARPRGAGARRRGGRAEPEPRRGGAAAAGAPEPERRDGRRRRGPPGRGTEGARWTAAARPARGRHRGDGSRGRREPGPAPGTAAGRRTAWRLAPRAAAARRPGRPWARRPGGGTRRPAPGRGGVGLAAGPASGRGSLGAAPGRHGRGARAAEPATGAAGRALPHRLGGQLALARARSRRGDHVAPELAGEGVAQVREAAREGEVERRPRSTCSRPWMTPLSISSSMVGRVSGPHTVPLSLRTKYCRTSPSAMRGARSLCEGATLPPPRPGCKRRAGRAARPVLARQGFAPSSAASPSRPGSAASASQRWWAGRSSAPRCRTPCRCPRAWRRRPRAEGGGAPVAAHGRAVAAAALRRGQGASEAQMASGGGSKQVTRPPPPCTRPTGVRRRLHALGAGDAAVAARESCPGSALHAGRLLAEDGEHHGGRVEAGPPRRSRPRHTPAGVRAHFTLPEVAWRSGSRTPPARRWSCTRAPAARSP